MTLTEQWKKGELEAGWYYVKNEFGNIFISDYSEDYDYIGDKIVKDFFTEVSEITEVIAPVPSYEKYKCLKTGIILSDSLIKNTEKENKQLKELLISAKDIIEWYSTESGYIDLPTKDLLTKIDNAIGEKK